MPKEPSKADPRAKTKKAPKKPRERTSLRQRIGRRLERGVREVTMLFNVLFSEPRRFPSALVASVRTGLDSLWQSRGGGFYGLGAVAAFVYLEVRLVVGEFAESEGVAEFLTAEIIEFIFRLGFMSIVNSVLAFIWPFILIARIGLWPALALIAGAYWMFRRWRTVRRRPSPPAP